MSEENITQPTTAKYDTSKITESTFISTDEVSRYLGVSRDTIEGLRKRGEFGPSDIKIGPRLVRWNRREFMDWMNAGCPKAAEWQASKVGSANE